MNFKRHLLVLAFFGGLAALSMNILLLHIHEYVGIGNGGVTDYYHSYWNYWWIRHALTTPGLHVYETNFVLFPYTSNLGLHTLAPFWFPLWAILEPITNVHVAVNTILWLGVTLTGYVTFLFLREHGANKGLALVGGSLMAMQPVFTWATAMTLPVYVGGFWYPLALMCWARVAKYQNIRYGIAMGLIFWGMLMTDHSSLVILAFILVPYGIWTLIAAADHTARLRICLLGVLALTVFLALGWTIAPLQPILKFDNSTVSPADLAGMDKFSLTLKGFLHYSRENNRAIGATVTLLTLVTLFLPAKDQQRWFYFVTGLLCVILAMGPYLIIGETRIPLLYRVVYEATGGLFRMTMHFAPAGVLMLLVFIGRTWTPYLQQRSRNVRMAFPALLLLVLMADLRVLQPIPAGKPITQYEFYTMMRNEPYDDYVVVDLPLSVGSGWVIYGKMPYAQFSGMTHEKRMTNGLIARVPDSTYEIFIYHAVLGWLSGTQPLRPEIIRPQLAEIGAAWNLGYIVVHQDYMNFPTEQGEEVIGFLNELDYLCPVTVEGEAVLYRAQWHPDWDKCPPRHFETAPNTYEIDFGVPGDEFFTGLGFHRQEVIGGPAARWLGAFGMDHALIHLDLPPGQAYSVTFEATSFQQPRDLTLSIEGQAIGEFTIGEVGFNTYMATIPADLIPADGKVMLQLDYGTPISGADLGLSGDERPLSIALNWMRFVVINYKTGRWGCP